jgi:hypothetical protein
VKRSLLLSPINIYQYEYLLAFDLEELVEWNDWLQFIDFIFVDYFPKTVKADLKTFPLFIQSLSNHQYIKNNENFIINEMKALICIGQCMNNPQASLL